MGHCLPTQDQKASWTRPKWDDGTLPPPAPPVCDHKRVGHAKSWIMGHCLPTRDQKASWTRPKWDNGTLPPSAGQKIELDTDREGRWDTAPQRRTKKRVRHARSGTTTPTSKSEKMEQGPPKQDCHGAPPFNADCQARSWTLTYLLFLLV
ncbi:unnamed protein product [Nesidiocoris tenuis]|uniref:Uncharacterized protein n=1 Tax=Nesidiocoris tenuis TaxID=355587 RepID=A0A6H5GP15_9HEMI|nr:unnamed protein product [Nesidiocoris tenuis]